MINTNSENTESNQEELFKNTVANIAHNKLLGITVLDFSEGTLKLNLPYSDAVIGDIDTGIIHGGALTTLMDNACGFAALSSVASENSKICPTLDLRIDYMQSATPGYAVIGSAETYRVTRNVIFVRGVAYHENEKDKPIAHCTATFMRLKNNR